MSTAHGPRLRHCYAFIHSTAMSEKNELATAQKYHSWLLLILLLLCATAVVEFRAGASYVAPGTNNEATAMQKPRPGWLCVWSFFGVHLRPRDMDRLAILVQVYIVTSLMVKRPGTGC